MSDTLFNYADPQVAEPVGIELQAIRPDIAHSHRQIWRQLARPGCWWSGPERTAIAQESRNARHCPACVERKSALSPDAPTGPHNATTDLPDVVVDTVHRITTDPSRLSAAWLSRINEEGLTTEAYVELLGIIVAVISIDGFHRALGLPLEPLPAAESGEASGYRPPGAKDSGAWVPTVQPEDAGPNESDLYPGGRTGNVISAMSLVPDAVRMLITLSDAHYIPMHCVPVPGDNGGRALTRSQIELIAGRVSSISECFY
ncbi:MAG: hypothetical protein NXH85_03805 [Pseudomonadaceae bacterium]|nr:hypothetical protein [Pseudomonadaceae bacterium]